MFGDLYNSDILGLAATLTNERLEAADGSARKLSKLCGSWVEIDLNILDGRVSDYALRVQACALGQAAAAILQEGIIGADYAQIVRARDDLMRMLKDSAPPPSDIFVKTRFSKLELLAGVRDYPARHTSTLLAFEAAVAAFDMALVQAHV